MKKVILVLSAAAFFVACNSGTSSTEANTDSTTKVTVDSTVSAPAVVDTTHVMVTDSTIKKVDSTKK